MHRLMPSVGSWFQDCESGVVFEVVAVDPETETIEIQFMDGEIGEYDLDSYSELTLIEAAEPEDWGAAFELDREDRYAVDDIRLPENWSGAINDLEPLETLSWAEP